MAKLNEPATPGKARRNMSLYLFDVSNIFYRSFYGNDRLSTSYGLPTQGLYGFLRTISAIVREQKPEHVAFVMEGHGESPRKAIEPLYKANRSEPPEDLITQLKMLPELMYVMGYPTFSYPGYEADDTIATLANEAVKRLFDVVIVSSDKDFNQLICPGIRKLDVAKNTMVDEQEVVLRYGIAPSQFLDYLSIVGDNADNIKGVKGIGEKGAMELIKTYGSLDGIYQNLNFIKGAKKDKLVASREDVYKARKLISFLEAPLPKELDFNTWCKYGGPRVEEARTLFRKLEFRELETALIPSNTVNVGGVDIGVRK
jgi:DNA polymerase-1